MSKKSNSDSKFERTSHTDDIISSYLGDLLNLGDDSSSSIGVVEEARAEVLAKALKEAINSATIDRSRALISTADILALSQSKTMLSKPQAFTYLLISLYFLRRPLPQRVRRCFFEVSERMLDDYEASEWQAQMANSKGVRSEARS